MTSAEEAGPSDYDLPRPTRVKLKKTRAEAASKLYRREQRRQQRDQARISRANGCAVSPPRPLRSESISPPRNPPKRDVIDDNGGYRWMGGYGHVAVEERKRREEEERMNWLIQEEMSRSDPFSSIGYGYVQPTPDTRIPHRHRHHSPDRGHTRKRRDPSKEVEYQGGPVPDIGSMTEEEYTAWIRDGMFRRKNREEVEERERIKKLKEDKEKLLELEREKAEKEERRRIRKLEKQKGREQEDRRKDQRDRYRTRWKSIGDTGGDIEEAGLTFEDIPWPIYRVSGHTLDIEGISKDTIKEFMTGIAEDGGEDQDLKKVLRDAIRAFHPDRFFGRILPRVRDADKEIVKEGVEKCSRVINALATENRG